MLRRSVLKSLAVAASSLPLRAHASAPPNVILISLDQLHAARLHCYGNPRPTSPNLDRLAAEGTLLTEFYASAPWTTPSYGAIMTSQHPSRHGATLFHPPGVPGLKPDAIPLAQLFKKAGYKTAAFVNNSVAGAFLTARGFDDYDESQRRAPTITERPDYVPTKKAEGSLYETQEFRAPATNRRVIKWLDANSSEPFFLFLLYFEPHSPYDPPPEHDLFKNDAYPEATHTGYDVQKGALLRKANLRDPQAIERLYQLYDGKIHFIDHYIGQLVDHLRATGLDKNTILLLTSDHGELIYQHIDDYMTFDHRSLYDNVLHVPFILWGQGVPRGVRSAALGSHLDIGPTLLELAGLPAKPDAQGYSLAPVIRGKEKSVRQFAYSEQDVLEPLRAVYDGRYKLIWNKRTGAKHLFDYANDRKELYDVGAQHPEIVEKLSALLVASAEENETDKAWRDRKWVEIAAKSRAEQVIDEVTTGAHLHLTGLGWKPVDGLGNFAGGAYWTEPQKQGEAERTATWRPDNPLLGKYKVSVWYGGLTDGGAAPDASFTVVARSGSKATVVDQTRNQGSWQELGIYNDPLHVVLSNKASGRIVVDAVKFERLG